MFSDKENQSDVIAERIRLLLEKKNSEDDKDEIEWLIFQLKEIEKLNKTEKKEDLYLTDYKPMTKFNLAE